LQYAGSPSKISLYGSQIIYKRKNKKKTTTPALDDDNFSKIMNNPSHINIR
jgi:hypothetical protein